MSDESSAELHELFLRYFTAERHRIFGFIFSLTASQADAEDVFQQTSLTLWKKFHKFDQNREFYPWACGVAFLNVKSYRRTRGRDRLVLNEDAVALLAKTTSDSSMRGRYRLELLEECLARLKPEDRALVTQVYAEGSSAIEVAQQARRAVQTIYNRLNLIRNQLLECVNRKEGLEASH